MRDVIISKMRHADTTAGWSKWQR